MLIVADDAFAAYADADYADAYLLIFSLIIIIILIFSSFA